MLCIFIYDTFISYCSCLSNFFFYNFKRHTVIVQIKRISTINNRKYITVYLQIPKIVYTVLYNTLTIMFILNSTLYNIPYPHRKICTLKS